MISAGQFEIIKALVRDAEFRDLLTACWETGCRPQEVLSVEAKHVNVTEGCWAFATQESKGKDRQRIVYLTDVTLAITTRLMAAHPHGRLFLNTDGKPWSASALNCRFTRLRLALGRKQVDELKLMPPKLKRLSMTQRADATIRKKHLAAVQERRCEIAELARRQVPRYSLYTLRHSLDFPTNGERSDKSVSSP